MTDDEAEGRELGRQMEAVTEAIRAAALRLLRGGEVDPWLVVLAAARVTGEPGASAALAGEYAAAFAAARGLAPDGPLDEATRLMRRRGAAVHHGLAPDSPVGSGHELPLGGEE